MNGMDIDTMLEVATRETAALRNPDDREDARQEMLLGMWEATQRGEDREGLRAYQWAYGRGYVKTFLQKQKVFNYLTNREIDAHAEVTSDGDGLIDLTPSDVDAPEECSSTHELHQLLHENIDALSDSEAHVIREYYLKDRTLEEVGQDLGMTKERVRQIRENAMERLRFRMGALVT